MLQILGEVDQLDPAQLIMVGLLCRRIACVVNVYEVAAKKGEKADWGMAEHWLSCPLLNRRYTMVDGELKKCFANSIKEEAFVDKEICKAGKKD